MKKNSFFWACICLLWVPLEAQINSQLNPGGINFRNNNTTGALLNWDGTLLSLLNDSGKEGDLVLGSGGGIIFQSGGTLEHLRLLSTGRLVLGAASASGKFGIVHHSTSVIPHLELEESNTGEFADLRFSNNNSFNHWQIAARADTDPAFQIAHFDGTQTANLFTIDGISKQFSFGAESPYSSNATLKIYNDQRGNQEELGNTYDIYTRPAPSIWTRYGLYTYVSGAAEGVDISTQGQKIGISAHARSSGNTKTGVYAYAGIGTGTNYGVHTVVNGIGGAESYALYAQASGGNSSSSPPVWAGYFAGDVFTTGSYLPSDQKLKSSIRKAGSSLDRLRKLPVKTYRYTNKYQQKMGLDQRPQTGFLAHEIKSIFPELTREVAQPLTSPEEINAGQEETFLNFTGVNYVGLIPHLTQAIQEQQQQIEVQETKLRQQQTQIENLQASNRELMERMAALEARLSGTPQKPASSEVLSLTDAQLAQNAPNPFSAKTRIRYFIPEQVQNAKLDIMDTSGRTLKSMIIDGRGKGQVELEAHTLSAGQYTYRLVLDGRILDSKKMILTK